MTGYFCPVEGCNKHTEHWENDQPPFASREAVRGHINAMSDDDHQRARDEGAWREAPEAPEGGDGEGDETNDEQPTDQEETSDDQETDQADEGGEGPLEEDQMVSQEEYDQQQTSETEGQEADDDQPATSDEGTPSGGSTSGSSRAFPEVPPMTAFVLITAVFLAIVLWRVYRARQSSEPMSTVQEETDEEADDGPETPLIEA